MNRQKGFALVEGLVIILIVGALSFAGWYVWNSKNNTRENTKNTSAIDNQSQEAPKISSGRGAITGTASYPSSGLPSDEEVCAVRVDDSSTKYCVNVGELQKSCDTPLSEGGCEVKPITFSLKLPVGNYYVYATAEKEMPGYRAYYDEFAKCGNSASCPSSGHKNHVKVAVLKDKSVGADPSDWYSQ